MNVVATSDPIDDQSVLGWRRWSELVGSWDGVPLEEATLPPGVSALTFLVNPVKKTSAAFLNGTRVHLLPGPMF